MLHNNYSELTEYIDAYEAGWTKDPSDFLGIKHQIIEYLNNPKSAELKSQSAQELVEETLNWNWTIGTLACWCKAPEFRPEKEQSLKATGDFVSIMLDRKEKELAEVRSQLETLNGKWFVKIARRMNKLSPILAPFVYLITWPLSRILARKLDIQK